MFGITDSYRSGKASFESAKVHHLSEYHAPSIANAQTKMSPFVKIFIKLKFYRSVCFTRVDVLVNLRAAQL